MNAQEPRSPTPLASQDPRYAEAVAWFGQGQMEQARALALAVWEANPQDADALNLIAAAAMNSGDLAEAEARWRQTIALNPHYFAAYSNLGLLLQNHRRFDEAEATYRQALAIKPDFDDALYNLGLLFQERGDENRAAEHYQQVLAINPRYAKAAQNLGAIHQRQHRWREAEACYRQAEQALRQGPSSVESLYKNFNNLGLALQSQRRFPEAAQVYRQALALNPGYTLAANNLGLTLHELGDWDAAEAAYRQVLQYDPQSPDAWNNLANLIRLQGRFEEAEAAYQKALAARPDYPEGMSNYGLLLSDTRRYDEADALFRESLRLSPHNGDAALNYSLLLLMRGQYEAGWTRYEARYDPSRNTSLKLPKLDFPRWQGEAVAGKSLLIFAEQGYGDEIQFSRYLLTLKALGARRVDLVCKKALLPLLAASQLADRVVTSVTQLSLADYDAWDMLMSIPFHSRAWEQPIPNPLPYLKAPPERVAHWAPRLPAKGFKVGLVWKGNLANTKLAFRSLAGLADLAPLWQVKGVQFISLQKGPGEEDAAPPPADQPLLPLGAEIGDFADSAAIVSQLDLMITVDSAPAHLAAALGVPCWVFTPFRPDWRWPPEWAESPWYPGVMRHFRQSTLDTPWSEVVAEVAAALKARVQGKKEKPFRHPKRVKDQETARQANDRGVACQQAGQWLDAEAAYLKARRLAPDEGLFAFNLGTLYQAMGRLLPAEIAQRDAIRLAPEMPEPPYNLGLILLAQGRYGEAWPAYEARYHPRRKVPVTLLPQLPFPLWQGEPLSGRSILVWLEQGFGDEIQFARYLPLLKAQGARQVTLVCKPPLAALFTASGLVDTVQAATGSLQLGMHDYWVPLMNLGRWCGTRSVDDIPAQLPYLRVPADRLAHWAPRLQGPGFKVGLVWKGQGSHGNDAFRSLAGLAQLAPLWQVPGLRFFSLQKGQAEDEASQPPADQPLVHLGSEIQDFTDTAAILQQLDLVICVDTAIAHLAGALGRPTWVLLPARGTDWRWLQGREDSPWYPGALRLFRQGADEGWPAVITRLAQALAERAQPAPVAEVSLAARTRLQQVTTLESQGQWAEAEALLRDTLAQAPGYARAWQKLAQVLQSRGQTAEAERAYRQALTLDPAYAVAWNNFGIFLQQQQRLAEAIDAYTQALHHKPDYARAHYNLGTLYQQQGDNPGALRHLAQAVGADAGYAKAHWALGNAWAADGQKAQAVRSWQAAVAADPNYSEAWQALGQYWRQQGRLPEAEAAFRAGVAAHPGHSGLWLGLGVVLKEQHQWAEAEAAYRRALAINPDDGSARMNLGMLLLTLGRLAEGWPYYESRADRRRADAIETPNLPFPQWRGESLQGKSIMVWPEQGFGDKFQFVRYLPVLKAMGARRVTLVCSPPLGTLFQQLPGADDILVVEDGQVVPVVPHDYWCLMLSLPGYCGSTLDNLPARLPYLQADPVRRAAWAARLPASGRKVGLVWRGRPTHLNDSNRSLGGLADLAPLWQVPGLTFISLQKGEGEGEAAVPPPGQPLLSFTEHLQDFADTAALISQLDLVICVDTAVAHLTGALGKPCWVMLPSVGLDWRWLTERQDSPWYPGVMRLYRQPAGEAAWTRVIQAIANDLQTDFPGGGAGPDLETAMGHWEQGRSAQALAMAREGVTAHPDSVPWLNLAGIAALAQGDAPAAARWLRQAAGKAQGNADVTYNLGLAYQALGDLQAARAAYQQALDWQPGHVSARHNLGRVLHQQGHWQAAENTLREVVAHQPQHADAWHNLGLLLADRQRPADAETAFQAAVRVAPQQPDFRLSLALRRLARGAWADAWGDYEYRYHPGRREPMALSSPPFPRWQGEPLAGKRLLIWPEQGLGDEIQCVRYLPRLKALGAAHITLLCKPPLLPLLQGVSGADAVMAYEVGAGVPIHDLWVLPMSLPGLCGTVTPGDIPPAPYLSIDPARQTAWADRLLGEGAAVGLVWRGNPEHPRDADRSMADLALLAPLGEVAGLRWISLQKGLSPAEGAWLADKLGAICLDEALTDLAETAAVISHLDLVLTVDTAVAHLAGALGKPVWLLLGARGLDWRWGDAGDHSPWYGPDFRLFRQGADEGWPALLARVAAALRQRFGESAHWDEAQAFAEAVAAYDRQNFSAALAACRTALTHRPHSLDFLNLAAGAAMALGRHAEGEPWLRQAAARYPEVSAVQANLGVLLHEMGQWEAAEPYCRRAVQMDPSDAGVHSNLGSLLQDMGRFDEAEAAYGQALAVDPDNAMALNNLGSLMRRLQRYDEAQTHYHRAASLAPQSHELAYNLASLCLAQGRYQEGWALYESRRRKRASNTFDPLVPYPRWQGESLQGKSILVWPEQGFGDEIQFIRYLPRLKALGAARITLGAKGPLRTLLDANRARLGVDEVLQESGRSHGIARFTRHDYWVHLMSLPGLLGDQAPMPAPLPYLAAEPDERAAWAARLPTTGCKVGLVWRGNPRHANDRFRSLPGLEALAPWWTVPGITFISLQKGAGEDEAATAGPQQPLLALGSDLTDFAAMAAVISQLDLVISVDTAVAHLAGALGKPVWLLLPWIGLDWRWPQQGARTPWYPSARLFRQPDALAGWAPVVAEVQAALADWAKGEATPTPAPAASPPRTKKRSPAKTPAQEPAMSSASPPSQATPAQRAAREKSLALYRAGDFMAAVQNQILLINDPTLHDDDKAENFNLLGGIFHALADHPASVMAMGECARLRPHDPQAQENLAVALKFAGRVEEAVIQFERTMALGHVTPNLLDGLASALSGLQRYDEARQRGRESLELKDAQYCAACTHPPLVLPPRKPFRADEPARNVIAFSLWGDKPRYIQSAVENVIAAKHVYPAWQCRFYCDNSVPADALARLKAEGAQIRMMPANKLYEGLFWRFLVVNDPEVDFFLVRDADAVVNTKERVAVDEWLASDRHFHLMRDWYTHTEVILAGMWGGVAGLLPDLNAMLAQYRTAHLETRTLDQQFLRTEIWPLIKPSVMIHDSLFDCLGSRPFPTVGQLPPGKHIGQSIIPY